MLEYKLTLGMRIESAILEMKKIAIENNTHVKAMFNDTQIILNPDSDVTEVLRMWYVEQERQTADRAKLLKLKYEIRSRRCNKQVERINELLSNLPDFASFAKMIAWFEELQKCDMVLYGERGIVEIFAEHGYSPNANCYSEFDKEDEDNVARWVIGQALNFIEKVGTIPEIYCSYAADWREIFGIPADAD